MISETGNNRQRGFSLIEILVVIGLIALAGGLVAINAKGILQGLGQEPVDRIFLKALREARFQAAFRKEATRLRYDDESAKLLIFNQDGAQIEEFSLDDEDLRVTFEQVLPARGLGRIGREGTTEIEAVVFRQDRSSTPFIVTFDTKDGTFSQRFDPFSDTVLEDSRSE